MRARELAWLLVGALIGALALYYVLWRTDGLSPQHLLARSTADWRQKSEPLPPVPSIPFPTPRPSPYQPTAQVMPDVPLPVSETAVPQALTPSLEDFAGLKGRSIAFPLRAYRISELKDTFHELRGRSRRHEALDILAPRGTPVLAVDDGPIVKLFTSKQGGLTIYQFDGREHFCYYYAHLDRYADGLKEGALVRRGEQIGTVGTTGNSPPNTPHLHFAVFRLGAEKRWWEGTPVNPYPLFMRGRDRRDTS